MTSNIAGEEIKYEATTLRRSIAQAENEGRYEPYVHLIEGFTRRLRPQMKQHLKRDEFIGRINQILVFLPLNEEEIRLVVERELVMWRKRAEEKHKIKMTWTSEGIFITRLSRVPFLIMIFRLPYSCPEASLVL